MGLSYGTGSHINMSLPLPQRPTVLSQQLFSYDIGTQSSLSPSPWVFRCCWTKRFFTNGNRCLFSHLPIINKLLFDPGMMGNTGQRSSDFHQSPLEFLFILQLSQNKGEESRAVPEIKEESLWDWQEVYLTPHCPTNKNKIKISQPLGRDPAMGNSFLWLKPFFPVKIK